MWEWEIQPLGGAQGVGELVPRHKKSTKWEGDRKFNHTDTTVQTSSGGCKGRNNINAYNKFQIQSYLSQTYIYIYINYTSLQRHEPVNRKTSGVKQISLRNPSHAWRDIREASSYTKTEKCMYPEQDRGGVE